MQNNFVNSCSDIVNGPKATNNCQMDWNLELIDYWIDYARWISRILALQCFSFDRNGIGTSGSKQTFLYADVTDDMKVGTGGGIAQEGELIETVDIPISEVKQFVMDESKHRPVGVMFAVFWYFDQVQKS